eukprot:SAG11_NODE_1684_length_4449_cov_7.642299_1_plen_74_part_10
MGQKVGAAACSSLMDLTWQPEASWAVSSGLGDHHRLQQERHHDSTALRRAGDDARPEPCIKILKSEGGGGGGGG